MSTATSLQTRKLIMVTENNNNKYYDMKEQGDGTFIAEYGRVQGGKQTKTYPMSKWDSTLRSKVKKGYKDVTELFAEAKVEEKDLFQISNAEVKRIIKLLDSYSKKSVQQNYSVSSHAVTKAMVDEAQGLIDQLLTKAKKGTTKEEFNKALLEVFHVIPRKMGKVNDYLIDFDIKTDKDVEEANKFVAKEQDVLDPLRTQVDMNATVKQDEEDEVEQIDILKVMGIEMEPVTDSKEIDKIKKLMGPDANLFRSAFKVKNHKTEKEFDKWVANAKNKKTELFWHGSRNENWTSILTSGLVLRPTNAVISGKMFGYGTYFADKFRKSLGYTSLRGSYWAGGSSNKAFLSLYKVHVGEQLHIKHHQSWCYDLTEQNLKKRGSKYDSLWAEGGADLRNDEFIVYNQSQTTVEYIVEVER